MINGLKIYIYNLGPNMSILIYVYRHQDSREALIKKHDKELSFFCITIRTSHRCSCRK